MRSDEFIVYSSDKYQVLLYEIEAPLMQRFHRYQAKAKTTLELEEFVMLDDKLTFSIRSDSTIKPMAKFINREESLDLFHNELNS